MNFWQTGQIIIIREIWQNKIYSAVPLRIVEDTETWAALYLPPRTPCLWPVTEKGDAMRIPKDEWILKREKWTTSDVLYIVQPGSGYTAVMFWNNDYIFHSWKLNLEKPMHRTSHGFDYMDQMLDIIVSADRRTWRWKDEDEVIEAQALGVLTAKQAKDLYKLGEQALQTLLSNKAPFNKNWENWKPDPEWRTPLELPSDWDQL
ncbi:MAG: DUF402 domain-containing protein [Anaerolineales bacterium]